MKRVLVYLCIVVLMIGFVIFKNFTAKAHRPLNTKGEGTRINPIIVPDHKISWAAYNNLNSSEDVDYYQFEADKGDKIYASILIPVIDGLEDFNPEFALIGPDLDSDYGGLKQNEIEERLEIREGEGVIVKKYSGQRSGTFFEPFTQTTYWEKQEATITALSQGKYYLAVFSNQNIQGKYVLSIGRKEKWGVYDLARMPKIWWDVRMFTENKKSTYVITGLLTAAVIFLIFKIGK
ncbi:MAG: hypothetical protein ACQEQH_04400 [Bacillota bacterium]